MSVVVHPAAEQDVIDAAEFYRREASPALAARFVAEFRRVCALLLEQPALGSPRAQGRRGYSMRIFPYSVIYRETATGIHVLVVRHDRRHPGFGTRRS